jgi:hypothetical protein
MKSFRVRTAAFSQSSHSAKTKNLFSIGDFMRMIAATLSLLMFSQLSLAASMGPVRLQLLDKNNQPIANAPVTLTVAGTKKGSWDFANGLPHRRDEPTHLSRITVSSDRNGIATLPGFNVSVTPTDVILEVAQPFSCNDGQDSTFTFVGENEFGIRFSQVGGERNGWSCSIMSGAGLSSAQTCKSSASASEVMSALQKVYSKYARLGCQPAKNF